MPLTSTQPRKDTTSAITFSLHSPNGDQGFPGNALIQVTYELDSTMDYRALVVNMGRSSATRQTIDVTVPEGYSSDVVIRWGDPLFPDSPAFDFENQTAAAQERQYGFNCDLGVLQPMDDRDERFDVAREFNETHRFGWLVEVDPWDPASTPVKHSAVGRFKHEGGTVHVTPDGTVVVYSDDDERFDVL